MLQIAKKRVRVFAMGAILLIEDDRNVHGLIEKILPKEDLRILKAIPAGNEGGRENREFESEPGPAALEESVRRYLRGEVESGADGHLHESVIGKLEKVLIGIILEEEKGNQVRVARRLGINRNTLRRKIRELNITTRVVTR